MRNGPPDMHLPIEPAGLAGGGDAPVGRSRLGKPGTDVTATIWSGRNAEIGVACDLMINRSIGRAAAPMPVPAETSIGGLPIAVIDRDQSARLMVDLALARRSSASAPPVITSANGQIISMCARDPGVRSLFLAADLIHADGMPLVFASRLKCRMPLPERVATTDLFHDVARRAQAAGASFYMLGGTREVIKAAVARVRDLYPRLAIAGFRHGYCRRDGDEGRIIAEVDAARPDILWIGMGAPLELAFSLRNRERLTNVGLIKTSGGLFDFVSGRNRRAPAWMQAVGLEWLHRLALEPRRLFYRYLTTNPHALYVLLTRSPDA
jgi:N-acetylglucosaminyldiphosphoundecaprenol N-acetyl-beta-D-mannosaminyltransferase